MRAFEVSLNGKKLCVAGIGEDGVLSTCLNWVTRGGVGDLFLQVGGLISPTEESVTWVRQKPLKVGDCIHPKKDNEKFAGEKMLYIDPVECIDCGACVPVCPVSAIFAADDVPDKWKSYTELNAKYFGR